jgi:hypothetical protein
VRGQPSWWRQQTPRIGEQRVASGRPATGRLFRWLRQVGANPFRLWARSRFSLDACAPPALVAGYESFLRRLDSPAVCLIEHPGFAPLVSISERYGAPVVGCFHNIEAFDLYVEERRARGALKATLVNFAEEMRLFARCQERLFISRVETGLVGGLGLNATYYPYRPVGEIRDRLWRIRQARAATFPEPGLFLMLGSAGHATTRRSFSWLLSQARRDGVPAGARLIVAGGRTESLLPAGESIAGVTVRGRLDQAELDTLLARVAAVILPQQLGFGALTRLPELSCAGIPALVSAHAANALELPPGVLPVDDEWAAWQAALGQAMACLPGSSQADYLAWEARQAQPLAAAIKRLAPSGRQKHGG